MQILTSFIDSCFLVQISSEPEFESNELESKAA